MYYVYKVTNQINEKHYIGVHKSNDIDNDPYMGSGNTIKNAIAKYGIDNFIRDIIAEYNNEEDAYRLEYELVDFNDPKSYNEMPGGKGGWDYVNSLDLQNAMHNPETVAKVVSTKKQNNSYHTEKAIAASKKNVQKAIESNIGRTHSDETRNKRSQSLQEHYADNESILKGIPLTEIHREAIRNGWSDESRKKKSEWMKDRIKNDPNIVKTNKGKRLSDEDKLKKSVAAKKVWEDRKKIVGKCPHCGKEGVLHNLKRWHFNNCKYLQSEE